MRSVTAAGACRAVFEATPGPTTDRSKRPLPPPPGALRGARIPHTLGASQTWQAQNG